MAGVKGRSGGARRNAGGRRPGAGRKPKPPVLRVVPPAPVPGAVAEVAAPVQPSPVQPSPRLDAGAPGPGTDAAAAAAGDPLSDGKQRDPLEFLEAVMNDPRASLKERIRAGIAAAQYRHAKKGEGGKRDARLDAADVAAGGRFAAAEPPRQLKLV